MNGWASIIVLALLLYGIIPLDFKHALAILLAASILYNIIDDFEQEAEKRQKKTLNKKVLK